MPSPADNEREDDFMRRCMADPEANSSFGDPAQRYAFCQTQWENRDVSATPKALLPIIAGRKQGGKFGGGITTADRYVRHVLDTCSGPEYRKDIDAVLKRASETLVFCDPKSGVEASKRAVAGMEALLPKGIKAPEKTLMVLQHVVTTPKEDRDTDVLVTEGAMLDPKSPLLWQHMHNFPIGKVLATIDHTKDVLRIATALLDLNELTEDAAKLIEADVLRFSHGFRALEWEERKDKDGQPIYGFRVNKFEIMEVSLVSVPSNTDAEIELFAAGKLHSPEFKSHAKHLMDQRNITAPGADFSEKSGKPEGDGAPAGEPAEPSAGAKAQGGPEDQAADPPGPDTGEKRGRVLSQRNQDALTETIDDLSELASGDGLTRAQKALVNKAISRLKSVLKEAQAGNDDDEERQHDPEPKAELTVADAMTYVLAEGTAKELNQLADTLKTLREVSESDADGEAYRSAVGIS